MKEDFIMKKIILLWLMSLFLFVPVQGETSPATSSYVEVLQDIYLGKEIDEVPSYINHVDRTGDGVIVHFEGSYDGIKIIGIVDYFSHNITNFHLEPQDKNNINKDAEQDIVNTLVSQYGQPHMRTPGAVYYWSHVKYYPTMGMVTAM